LELRVDQRELAVLLQVLVQLDDLVLLRRILRQRHDELVDLRRVELLRLATETQRHGEESLCFGSGHRESALCLWVSVANQEDDQQDRAHFRLDLFARNVTSVRSKPTDVSIDA